MRGISVRALIALPALTVLGLVGALAVPSLAQAAPLAGEVLAAPTAATITGGTCDPTATSTFTFTVSGVATGPYPGTFTESGSVTIGPQTVELFPGQFAGPVLDFQASFQIVGPLGTVTGTKRRVGDPGPTAPFNAGACFGGPGNAATAAQVYANALRYSATTPDGPDAGDTITQGNYYATPPPADSWREFFFGPVTSGPPATVTLSPPSATNPVGQQHCVTATVRDAAGNPLSGVSVVFAVSGANGAAGTRTTDASGQAVFCYTGTHVGPDAITAYADTNGSGSQDAGEPAGTATKIYTPAEPTTVTLSPKTATNTVGEQHCVTAAVTDAFGNPTGAVTVVFTVGGANAAGGSRTTDSTGRATFCYTGTHPGEDAIEAYVDSNHNGSQDAGEPFDTAVKTYLPGAPATLTLTPKAATNPVGTQHCVTATATDAAGNPTSNVTVAFIVTGSASATGSRNTDASGHATFCYTGPSLPGADAIRAYADTNHNGAQDAGEPSDAATKAWVLPASTPGCQVKVTNGGWIVAANGDRSSFGGNAKVDGGGVVSGNEEYQDHGPARPLTVHGNVLAVICTGPNEATIYGQATVDGGSQYYRIKVRGRRGARSGQGHVRDSRRQRVLLGRQGSPGRERPGPQVVAGRVS